MNIFKKNNKEIIQKIPLFIVKNIINFMNSKLLKLNNTTNYYHLIELCNLLLQSDLINPHIKSR